MLNLFAGSNSSEATGFGCDTDNQMLQTGAIGMRGPKVVDILGPPVCANNLGTETQPGPSRLKTLGREFLELVGRAAHESPSNIL